MVELKDKMIIIAWGQHTSRGHQPQTVEKSCSKSQIYEVQRQIRLALNNPSIRSQGILYSGTVLELFQKISFIHHKMTRGTSAKGWEWALHIFNCRSKTSMGKTVEGQYVRVVCFESRKIQWVGQEIRRMEESRINDSVSTQAIGGSQMIWFP